MTGARGAGAGPRAGTDAGGTDPVAALLGEIVDGNRSAHRVLTGVRYPGLPLDVFDRLHTVGGAERR
ncbi:hypothetical protein VR45_14985 [Streptomyces sp. NRRL S-495]|nr:hypothetical protein VR45_14985 [Streptomyces sp. NRRL S-495]